MEGRSESDCGGNELYSATFGNEEKIGLKQDDKPVEYGSRNRDMWTGELFCSIHHEKLTSSDNLGAST